MTLDTIWFNAMEAHAAASATFAEAAAAHAAAAAAHKVAQETFAKGHPDRAETFAALNTAKTQMEAARSAIWAAERAANVAGQTLRDEGDYAAAAAVYAREYQLPRSFAAAEAAVIRGGESWLAAASAVEKAAKTAGLWLELPVLWAASAPLSAARWAEGARMNRGHAHTEWERSQPTSSDVGWLRG